MKTNVLAGITVGVVALAAGARVSASAPGVGAAGLVAAVVAGLIAAIFGGSLVQVSGPTGAMAVILASIVAEHGLGGVALVTVLAGLIVLVAGSSGSVARITSYPGR